MLSDRTTYIRSTEEKEKKTGSRERTRQEKEKPSLQEIYTSVVKGQSNFVGDTASSLGESHGLLDLGDGESGVQALGTCPGAVEDGVAAVQRHGVVEGVLAVCGSLVTRVGDPAVGLEEDGGAEVFLRVPPVRGA